MVFRLDWSQPKTRESRRVDQKGAIMPRRIVRQETQTEETEMSFTTEYDYEGNEGTEPKQSRTRNIVAPDVPKEPISLGISKIKAPAPPARGSGSVAVDLNIEVGEALEFDLDIYSVAAIRSSIAKHKDNKYVSRVYKNDNLMRVWRV
jgi:hypothetical protein